MAPKNRTPRRGGRTVDRDSLPSTRRKITEHEILSIDEEIRLGLLIRMTGDREALNKLVRHNIRFAVMMARRYMQYGVELDDLIQQANLGLIEAAESFEPARGYRFISYASWHVRNRIFEALNLRHIIRRPSHISDRLRAVVNVATDLFTKTGHEPSAEEIAQALGITVAKVKRAQELIQQNIVFLDRQLSTDDDRTVGDSIHDQSTISPEVQLLAHNELNLLVRWFERIKVIAKTLPESDRAIFLSRYGLDDDSFELRPFPMVARSVGVKPDRVKQRIGSIIRRIRAVGVGSPLSEERLEFEIQRAHAIQAALADHSPLPRVE